MPTQRIVKLSKKEALVKSLKGKIYTAIIKEGVNIPQNPDTCFVEFKNRTPIISHFDEIEHVPLENSVSGATTLEMFF